MGQSRRDERKGGEESVERSRALTRMIVCGGLEKWVQWK